MGWKDDQVVSAPSAAPWQQDKLVNPPQEKKPLLQRAGNYVRGLVDEAANLGTGLSDEFGAAVDATIPTQFLYPTSQAPNWSQRYEENLAGERGRMKQFREENPVASTAANITGAVVSAANLPKALYSGATLPMNIAKGVTSGAVLGGGQAFGEGEGGFENRMTGVPLGAGIGAALGGAAPVVGAAAGYAYNRFAPKIMNAIADKAEAFVPKVKPASLSAAAPDGGPGVAQDGLLTRLSDALRGGAEKVEGDAAMQRLAVELQRSGGTKQAAQKLDELGESAFLADTSKGATRLANVGYIMPGEASDKYAAAYANRNAETGKRFLKDMGPLADAPGTYNFNKFFEGYKSGKGKELYDPVLRSGKLNVTPELAELAQRPSIKQALETVDGWAKAEGKALTEAERFHMVKQALNQNADAAFQSGKPVNKNMMGDTAADWERALWSANPEIQAADTAYAKIASVPEWRDRGQNLLKRGYSDDAVEASTDALAAELPKATSQQRAAATVGAANVMQDAAKAGPKATRRMAENITTNSELQGRLGELVDPAVVDQLMRGSKRELQFARGSQDVIGGSHSAQRVASLADDAALSIPQGGTPTPASLVQMLATGYHKLRQPSEAMRSRLADLLAEPNREVNAETLRLVEALLAQPSRARPFSAGAAGSAGGATQR